MDQGVEVLSANPDEPAHDEQARNWADLWAPKEAYASRAHDGAPDWQVDAWVSTYTAITRGELAAVTNDVRRLTGTPATTLAEHLQGSRARTSR